MKTLLVIILLWSPLSFADNGFGRLWQRLFPGHSQNSQQAADEPNVCDELKELFENSDARPDILLHYAQIYGYQPQQIEISNVPAKGDDVQIWASGDQGSYAYIAKKDFTVATPVAPEQSPLGVNRRCLLPRWRD